MTDAAHPSPSGSPIDGRRPGVAQGVVLILAATLSVMGVLVSLLTAPSTEIDGDRA